MALFSSSSPEGKEGMRQRKKGEEKGEAKGEEKEAFTYKGDRRGSKAPAPSSIVNRKEGERIESMINEFSDKAPPQLAKILKAIGAYVGMAFTIGSTLMPFVVGFWKGVYKVYQYLPTDVLAILYGLGICFFGGYFAVSIAAMEAFNATGGAKVRLCIDDLIVDIKQLAIASEDDDQKDDDRDGVADVKQIKPKELVQRKLGLALRTIDPDRFTVAMTGVYQGYMGVLVVLKFQFARTIALAVSIGNFMRPLTARALAPVLAHVVPEDYRHWILPMINYCCKFVAMSIAWYIQRLISTVQSGIKGGMMASRGALRALNNRGWYKVDEKDTYLDELVGWGLAGLGIWFQVSSNWDLPFYVDMLFMPFHVLEWFLKWSVTWMDVDPVD